MSIKFRNRERNLKNVDGGNDMYFYNIKYLGVDGNIIVRLRNVWIVDWINLTRNKDRWKDCVNTVKADAVTGLHNYMQPRSKSHKALKVVNWYERNFPHLSFLLTQCPA